MHATHAAAQHIGDRSHQCDATATWTAGGVRAYALLDGIGSTPHVQEWTRTAARRLARAAATRGNAEAGLRAIHAVASRERARLAYPGAPAAVAVVATVTLHSVEIAWCGDARAYHLTPGGELRRLTKDHNQRQLMLDMGEEPGPGARNHVLSYLGYDGDHPMLGNTTVPRRGTLLLASDGAYEPLEDNGLDPAAYLTGTPRTAARTLVAAAIKHATPGRADNATVLVINMDPAASTHTKTNTAKDPGRHTPAAAATNRKIYC